MNKNLKVVAVFLTVLVLAASYKLFFNEEAGVTATGTIEIIHADAVPKLSGYMYARSFEVGDMVQKGQVLARIDRQDLQDQLVADEAAAAQAKLQLIDLEKGPRPQEIELAAANLAAAESVYEKADKDLLRYQALYASDAIAAQQLDIAQTACVVAYNAWIAAANQHALLLAGNREELIAAQRKAVEHAEALAAVTKAQIADTVVYSPLAGVILTKNYEVGEYVMPGSAITTIGDMSDCWVKVYVSTAQLGLIRFEEPVDVKVDAYPERTFAGRIREISQQAEFTPRQSITKAERTNLVFYIKVKLDNTEGILKAGMPADVIFR